MSWIAPLFFISLLLFFPINPFSEEPESFTDKEGYPSDFPAKDGNPKIDPDLLEKADHEYVSTVLELSSPASDLMDELALENITIETYFANEVLVTVPASRLEELSNLPYVIHLRAPHEAIPSVTSEGLEQLKVDIAHDIGLQGEGVRVAIIDSGFDLSNPEIRDNVGDWRSFTRSGDIRGENAGDTKHGTGVAEIVLDVAPKATLLLYNFDGSIDFRNAVKHAVRAGAQIISVSQSFFNVGPYDGTSSVSMALDDARARGVLPINAVGNRAKQHWQGSWTNPDADVWHNFRGQDETNDITLKSGKTLKIWLSWNDWPRSSQDYDLYLDDASGKRVARSIRVQNGATSPTEFISFTVPSDGTYQISIRRASATRSVFFELFVNTGELNYGVAESSVANLGDARGAVSVGATHWRTGELKSFSSRGPTTDGRIKPDVTAPDSVSTLAYSPGVFSGTSASTPHVAGLAALMLSGNPELTPDDLQNLLQNGAVDAGPSGRDNMFGSGKTRASFAAFTAPETASNILVDDVEYDVSQGPIGFVWSPGSRHTFEVLTTTVALGPGIRTDFQRWINLDQETLTINTFFGLTYQGGPSIFGAEFEKQFLLSVDSRYGSPEGSGWYKEDTLAFISLEDRRIDHGNKTRRTADFWVGDTTALDLGDERAEEQNREFSDLQTPVLLSSPVTLILEWQTQYLVNFQIRDSSGRELRGERPSMALSGPAGADSDISDTREYKHSLFLRLEPGRTGDEWLEPGTYHLEEIIWNDTDIKRLNQNDFIIDASSTGEDIRFNTRVYNIQLRVTDFLGLPAIEAETRVTTAGGERFFETVDSDGSVFISQVPLEDFEVRVSSLTGTTFVTGDASEGLLEIKVPLGMIGLIVLLIIAAALSLTLIVIRRRGRKSGEKTSSDLTSDDSEQGDDTEPQELSNPKFPI